MPVSEFASPIASVPGPSPSRACLHKASWAVGSTTTAPGRCASTDAASVAPLVKTTSAGWQPTASATSARARSTSALAARPSAWTEEGFPTTSIAATIAARASGLSGAVAFQSR
jgi:hypothetical protein